MSLPATIEPIIEVSWTGTGTFTGPYDDVTANVAASPGVSVDLGKDGDRSLSPPKSEAADFELFNDTGYYSSESASSPFYQLVIPGRPVRISARHGEQRLYRSHTLYRDHVPYRGRAIYRLASTALDLVTQTLAIGNRRVRFETIGKLTNLFDQRISSQLYANITTSQAISVILTQAGWPAALTAFDTGETNLLYWWLDERSPWEALLEVLASEGPGALWIDGDGVLHFESRNHRTVDTRSTTTQGTFYDVEAGQRTHYRDHVLYRRHLPYRGRTSGLWFTDMQFDAGLKDIVNRATFSTKRRALGSLQKVWEYGAQIVLSAGQSRTLIAKPSNPFQAAVAPVAGTDYTMTSGSATVSLTYTSGLVAFIVITAGGSGATIDGFGGSNGIQLRAQPLSVVSETVIQNNVDAATSIARYSIPPGANVPRTLSIKGWPEIDPNQAEAVCNAWVQRYMWQRPKATITLRNASAEHVRQILRLQVSDRITLRELNSGLTMDVWVESKKLQLGPAGSISAVIGCEKVDQITGYVWDGVTSLWDTATWGS